MGKFIKLSSIICLFGFFVPVVCAQETVQHDPLSTADAKPGVVQPMQKNDAVVSKTPPPKKMIQDATINLQATITGNQEQPRVLYILPWQSPQTEEVDFEPLDNQQKSVFGHVEREELRRELESAGELE